MSLPSDFVTPYEAASDFAAKVGKALHTTAPTAIYKGRNLLAVFDAAKDVRAIPGAGDIESLLESDLGLIATAAGDEGFDFVSRYLRAASRHSRRSGDGLCALRADALLVEASRQEDAERKAGFARAAAISSAPTTARGQRFRAHARFI